MKHCETSDSDGAETSDIASTTINQDMALELMRRYRFRCSKTSWKEVFRHIEKTGNKELFALSPQKLSNWENPVRKTPLSDRAFAVVISFINSELFQSVVPEARNYIDQKLRTIEVGTAYTQLDGVRKLNDIESLIFNGLKGLWASDSNASFLYIKPVQGYNFAVVQLIEKYYKLKVNSGSHMLDLDQTVHASGYMYFSNSSSTKNIDFEEAALLKGKEWKDKNIEKVYERFFDANINLVIWDRDTRQKADIVIECSSNGLDFNAQIVGNAYVGEFSLTYTDANKKIHNYFNDSSWSPPFLVSDFSKNKRKNVRNDSMKILKKSMWSVLPNELS